MTPHVLRLSVGHNFVEGGKLTFHIPSEPFFVANDANLEG